jgi:F0F1-type ATP synthase assembly protein I
MFILKKHLSRQLINWIAVSMSEEIKAPSVQDQISKIKKIIDRGLLWMFVAGAVSGLCLGFFWMLDIVMFIRPIGFIIGMVIWGGCFGFWLGYRQNAREDYRKLLEQLQQTHNVSE